MALVTEDGTGKADAASYATVAAFKAHCDARGITYGTDATIEQRLRAGFDYMLQTFRTRWAGYRSTTTQAGDWPRYDVPRRDLGLDAYYVSNAIPAEITLANILLAVRATPGEDLTPDETQAIKREKVGQLETEYQDFTTSGERYPAVDRLVAPFLSNGGAARMMRA
jgi:hypothetical protein